MQNMKSCPKHGPYPTRFESCPVCGPAKMTPHRVPTVEQVLARMTDEQVRYIFQNGLWEQGTAETRELCLAEYDRRVGLENWPVHISKDA